MAKLEVIILYELSGGEVWGYYSKGHVDKQKFVEEIEFQHDDNEVSVDDVKHCYARWTPAHGDAVCHMRFNECKPGRGAFKATFVLVN